MIKIINLNFYMNEFDSSLQYFNVIRDNIEVTFKSENFLRFVQHGLPFDLVGSVPLETMATLPAYVIFNYIFVLFVSFLFFINLRCCSWWITLIYCNLTKMPILTLVLILFFTDVMVDADVDRQ